MHFNVFYHKNHLFRVSSNSTTLPAVNPVVKQPNEETKSSEDNPTHHTNAPRDPTNPEDLKMDWNENGSHFEPAGIFRQFIEMLKKR